MRFSLSTSILILFVAATIGCSSMPMKKPDLSAILPAGPPTKVLAVWEPAVKHSSGEEKSQRGFGGRVYFYDQTGKRPIRVDGSVVVYAFDEEGRKPDDNVPTRSYLFEKTDVKKLYSKSKLGHSYNFWVPWDSEGSDAHVKKISLIVRFVPEVGSSVVSSQALIYLPGKVGDTQLVAKADWDKVDRHDGSIQQVSCLMEVGERSKIAEKHWNRKIDERIIESNDRPSAIQTTTIDIPGGVPRSSQVLAQTVVPAAGNPAIANPMVVNPTVVNQPSQVQQAGYLKPTDEAKDGRPAVKDPMGRGNHLLPPRPPAQRESQAFINR